MIKRLYILALLLMAVPCWALQVVPGLYGFGTDTRAAYGNGQNPTIIVVNELGAGDGLSDSTRNGVGVKEGSFKDAINYNVDNKFIIFEVSGNIPVNDILYLDNEYVTIAGETAPSPGVTFKGLYLRVCASDILISNMRIRQTDEAYPSPNAMDYQYRVGLVVGPSTGGSCTGKIPHNVVVNQSTVTWATDQNIGITGDISNDAYDITLANSIIGEGLRQSRHQKSTSGTFIGHSMGGIIQYCNNVSVIRNLWISNNDRNPVIQESAELYFANNFISHAKDLASYTDGASLIKLDYIGNVIEDDGVTSITDNFVIRFLSGSIAASSEFYLYDNYGVTVGTQSSASNWGTGCTSGYTACNDGANCCVRDQTAHSTVESNFAVTSAIDAPPGYTPLASSATKAHVVANAGAYPSDRDTVDTRLIADATNGVGTLIDSVVLADGDCVDADDPMGCCTALDTGPCDQNDEAGFPSLAENTTTHSDIPSSPHVDDDSDGYTNLEEWMVGTYSAVPTYPLRGVAGSFEYN